MKRTSDSIDEAPQFDAIRLWEFCGQLGITQELTALLTQDECNDTEKVRALLLTQHGRAYNLLKIVEAMYDGAQVFVTACLQSIFSAAALSPCYAPLPSPASLSVDTERTTKKGGQKKVKKVSEEKSPIISRSELIQRHSTCRDALNKKDYGDEWLSKFSVIGQPLRAQDALPDFETYHTIYHCHSAWGMEEILSMLQDEGFLAFGIRDDCNKSEECVRYKVITNEPFLA